MVGMFIDIQHKKECRFQDTNLQKKKESMLSAFQF